MNINKNKNTNTNNKKNNNRNTIKKTIKKDTTNKANNRSARSTGNDEKQLIRLNKYIADAGLVSRRKADELIASGVVKVNKQVVTELGTKIALGDFVTVKGDPIEISHNHLYVLLNKPKDCITTTHDEKNRKTVMDIVRLYDRVYPVGRLDRNTTGVLLLTNDGELANRLTHPRYQVQRIYKAKLDKPLKTSDASLIAKGIEIEPNVTTAPCVINIDLKDNTKVTVILTEGKNHEVKKMFEKLNYEVKSLDRKFYHNLSTKGLKRGEYRFLDRQEIAELRKLVNIK